MVSKYNELVHPKPSPPFSPSHLLKSSSSCRNQLTRISSRKLSQILPREFSLPCRSRFRCLCLCSDWSPLCVPAVVEVCLSVQCDCEAWRTKNLRPSFWTLCRSQKWASHGRRGLSPEDEMWMTSWPSQPEKSPPVPVGGHFGGGEHQPPPGLLVPSHS